MLQVHAVQLWLFTLCLLLNKFNAAFNLLWSYLKVDSTAFQLLKKSLKQINLVQDRYGTTIDDLVNSSHILSIIYRIKYYLR